VLKKRVLSKRRKIANIIPIIKPGKENSTDPSKYRPINLLNIGRKVLEKLLINRINYYIYKNKLMTKDNLDSRHRRTL
jgi:hypothetical protein